MEDNIRRPESVTAPRFAQPSDLRSESPVIDARERDDEAAKHIEGQTDDVRLWGFTITASQRS